MITMRFKRADDPPGDDATDQKRRKKDHASDKNADDAEAKSARDIQDWLAFRPDAPSLLQGELCGSLETKI
jgi:hypothetical protein